MKKKLFLIMKLTFFLTVCCLLQVHATLLGQVKTVDLDVRDATLKTVFEELKKQTELEFFFSNQELDVNRKVSIRAEKEDLSDVLTRLLGKNYGFEYFKNMVIIKPVSGEQGQVPTVPVSGVVKDQKGNPLPGVAVIIKGSNIGITTNAEGRFTLRVPQANGEKPVLIFTFIGMKRREVAVETHEMTVVMEEESLEVDEVVITGYQQIDRRNLTSAVTTLKMSDIDIPGVNRVDALLEGRIPGLIFMQNTGQVGAAPKLRIRGNSSILGNQEPLWVVDGIIQQDHVNVDPAQLNDLDFVNLLGNAISGLNPADIEQIDVLKDAAATALYGARAANGVIVITTKRGKQGPPSVSYSMSGTFTRRPRYTDRSFYMMNSKERVDVSRELMERGVRYTGVYNDVSDWIGYERAYLDYYKEGNISYDEFERLSGWYETMNTDWLDILTEDVFSHNHSLSINGGTDHIRYYASLGYADEQGNVRGEENKRYSSALKINLVYDRLVAEFGMDGFWNKKQYNPNELNVMSYAHLMSRAIPLYGEEGDLWFYKKTLPGTTTGYPYNILHEMNNSSWNIDQHSVRVNAQIQYKFTDAFRLRGVASYQFGQTDDEEWFGEASHHVLKLNGNGGASSLCPFGGTLKSDLTRNTSYTFRLQADYSKYLGENGKHFANAMAGYELSSSKYKREQEEVRGYYKDRGKTFPNFVFDRGFDFSDYTMYYMWLINNHPVYLDGLTNLVSAFMTLTYGYDNRYIINVNGRLDWSNAFGSRSNEKLFPIWSVSGRWNASNDLLKDVRWIDNLALKLSYGLQGNMLNNQPARLTINKENYDESRGGFVSTVRQYANPDLKWEKTHSYNIGLDFSFFNNKINGSFAYFFKKTTDAFLEKKVGSQNGITKYTVNAGSLENKGVELALNFTPIDNTLSNNGKRGLVWRIDPQIGQTLNKLVNRAINKNNALIQDEVTMASLLNGNAYIAGTPLNTFYSFRFNGLDKEGRPNFKGLEVEMKDELDKRYTEMAATDKRDVWLEILEESGSRVPTLQGGLRNYIAYRNLSLSFNLTYSIGNKIRMFKLCSGGYSDVRPYPHNNLRKEFTKRWREPGDEQHTNIPGICTDIIQNGSTADVERYYGWWRSKMSWRPADGNTTLSRYEMYDYSDLRVVSGDYLRLQSLIFSYSFDKELLEKAGISNAYVSLSAQNLFTICNKKLKGQNPEQFSTTDMVNISLRPSYTFSLNINF